jgi:phage tail sheath protein FI
MVAAPASRSIQAWAGGNVTIVSYPGIYIQETSSAPPIQGTGTSTAAFLGPGKLGPINEPVLVTSFDQFKLIFGDAPAPGFYLWYAVQGFFANGGTLAYVVRISNAALAELALTDRTVGKAKTVLVSALQPGALGNSIVATAAQSQALTALTAFKHMVTIATASGTHVTFATTDDAAKFRPGDIVSVDGFDADRATILSINGKAVTLSNPLPQAVATNDLRLASLLTAQGDRVIRFTDPTDDMSYLAPGSVLTLTNTTDTETVIAASVSREVIPLSGPTLTTFRVTLRAAVANDYGMAPADNAVTAESHEFDLTVTDGTTTETYTWLSVDPANPHYYGQVVNPASHLVTLSPAAPPDPNLPPDNLPDAQTSNLAGGANESLPGLLPADYQNGLDTLANLDVNIVAIPDRQDITVQSMVVAHCEGVPPHIGNRFAVLDSQLGAPITGAGSVADQVATVTGSGNGYAALYYPWVLVPPAPPAYGGPPPVAQPNLLVPPSGHIAGVYARMDHSRGVHKAPAGISANLAGTLGVERILGDTEQGLLNLAPYGVNVIRVFHGGHPTVWGARTTAVAAGNSTWQYINVRRLFIFLEQSITVGIRFALFEPNNLELWGKLKRSITAFLTKVWQDGALFGASAKEAFYVRIDDALNPPDQMALGYLTIEIGVRPAYPAEFIVVRIGITPGGVTVTD